MERQCNADSVEQQQAGMTLSTLRHVLAQDLQEGCFVRQGGLCLFHRRAKKMISGPGSPCCSLLTSGHKHQ